MDETDVLPPIYLNGEMIPVVDSDKHLGNYISTKIADRHIIDNIYCMHMYGFELWDLNCNYVKDFKVAWRKVKRRI